MEYLFEKGNYYHYREAFKDKRWGKLRAGVLMKTKTKHYKAQVGCYSSRFQTAWTLPKSNPPSDFYLFPWLKEMLFKEDSEVMAAVEVFLDGQDEFFL